MTLRHRIFDLGRPQSDSLRDRSLAARTLLGSCMVCELRCGVNRLQNEPCPCHLGADTYTYKRYISLNEESSLAPAFRVFLGGCNFRCTYCDEGPDCFTPERGDAVQSDRLAEELAAALDDGAKTIGLIGGEPSLHPHTILATAAAASRRLPLVLNSNMYMTPEVLDLLDGVVTLYLADFKFGHDDCARRLAGIPRYMEVVCRNVVRAAESTKVVVRHLLIPGHLDCCFRPVVDWMATNRPAIPFQLYTGYVPCWKASMDRALGRLNSRFDAREAIEYMNGAGLADAVVMDGHRWRKPSRSPGHPSEVSITIGADGRMYCHDLTPELAGVVGEMCSPQDGLTARSEFCAMDPRTRE